MLHVQKKCNTFVMGSDPVTGVLNFVDEECSDQQCYDQDQEVDSKDGHNLFASGQLVDVEDFMHAEVIK